MIRILMTALLLCTAWLTPGNLQAADVLCSMNDGQPVDGKTVLEKNGKKYEFCCSGCLHKFKESPEFFSREMTLTETNPAHAEAACSTVCSD